MNTSNNNKKIFVLITAIAIAAVMVVGPGAAVNPVSGMGHYDEGDSDSASQEYDRFDDCLSDHEHESNEVTEEQIEHCIDLAYHGESDGDDSNGDDANRQSEDEDEDDLGEDLEFFGDDSGDSDISSNNFNSDHDSADDKNSSTDY